MSSSRRLRALVPILLVVLFLVAALLLYQRLFGEAETQAATVLSTEGTVTLVPAGGAAVVAQPGATVPPGTTIRTDADGRSVLSFQDDAQIRVDPATDVQIETMTNDRASFRIGRGRVEADVPERGDRSVEFGAANSTARVASRGGRMAVAADGAGSLAVAQQSGNSIVAAGGEEVEVGPGEQIVVVDDKISEVMDIPSSLLLKVDWPELPEGRTRDTEVHLGGHAPAGTLLEIGGHPVIVRADGTFETVVNLDEGENQIEVRGKDAAGNTVENESQTIERDTRGPPIQTGPGVWQ